MNLLNQRRSVVMLIELNKRGCFDVQTRKQLIETIPAYETLDEMLLDLVKSYNISYLKLPEYAKSNYNILKQCCINRPKTIEEIFFLSFHKLAEVVKLLSLEELKDILVKAEIKPEFANCIISTKLIEIEQADQKANSATI